MQLEMLKMGRKPTKVRIHYSYLQYRETSGQGDERRPIMLNYQSKLQRSNSMFEKINEWIGKS